MRHICAGRRCRCGFLYQEGQGQSFRSVKRWKGSRGRTLGTGRIYRRRLSTRTAFEFIGEGCLIGQPKRLATASAMTECETMRVEKTEIQRVIQDEPAFSQMFVSHVLTRNARVEEDLVDQLFNSTEKRLARLLLLLANFGKEGRPEPILAKISQETLAEMIGTTRSRVSHFMNKFRKLGFISYKRTSRSSQLVTGRVACRSATHGERVIVS